MSPIQSLTFLVLSEPSTEIELATDEWLLAKRQGGRSVGTIEKYRETLTKFETWLAEREIIAPAQLATPEGRLVLRRWGAGLHDYGLAPATIRQRVASVRSFLGWCYAERIIPEDLRPLLKLPPAPPEPQRTLAYDEVLVLLEACCESSRKGIRDRALINFLVDTGLRAGEVCRVKVGDLALGVKFIGPEGEGVSNVVTVLTKGGKRQNGYFGAETVRCLEKWLPVRERYLTARGLDYIDNLFVSVGGRQPGQPMTVSGVRVSLRKLGEQAGVPGVTTHVFRRTMACLLEEAGASTREVMEYGRWSNLELVERYTQAYKAGRKFNQHAPSDYLRRIRDKR